MIFKKLITLILLLTSTNQIYSQHLNSVSISGSIVHNVKTKDLEPSFGINIYIYNIYCSFETNIKNIEENTYGKGYLTNEYIINSLELGYAFKVYEGYITKGRNNFYVIPCFGIRTYKQLYSDLYYSQYAYENIENKLCIGCNILVQQNYVIYSLLCDTHKVGFSLGICF